MGYFNIFYKITRIIDMLTRKRNRKVIAVILIAITLIWFLHTKGYCAQGDTTYTTDTTYFILEEYNNLVDYVVLVFDRLYGQHEGVTARYNAMFQRIQQGEFPYFYAPPNNSAFNAYFYNSLSNKVLVDTSLVYNDYFRVPSTAFNITIPNGSICYNWNRSNGYMAQLDITSDYNIAVPQIIYLKIPTQIIEIMQKAGYGYENQDIVDIKSLLQEQNNKLDTINDSLTDETYDENAVDFDTSSVDNVSDTEIQGLFTGVIVSFQNSLASYGGTITKIIPLPHGGQLEIPSNIVSSHLGSLSALVEAFWYFVFGIYLFRFVSNLIHKIKSGDILNGYTNDNEIITSSML